MSNTSDNPLQTFWEEGWEDVLEAQDTPDEDWRGAIDEARTPLELQWATAPTAELAYAIGYCWFHMPGHDQGDFDHAKEWLLRAVEMDPDHRFAAYYLGCLFFEYQLWNESERWLKSIPVDWFESRDFAWRERKREEMLICINLMTNAARVSAEDIQKVMAIHHDDPSVEVWPLPSELVETVSRLRQIDLVSFRRLAPVLAQELAATGLLELFEEEIKAFNS